MSLLAIPSGTSSNAGGFYPNPIDQSLRFNDNDSAYLSKAFASDSDVTQATFSFWLKRCALSSDQHIYQGRDSTAFGNNNNRFFIKNQNDKFGFFAYDSGGSNFLNLETTPVYRDVSAWYHIVLKIDTTQVTASDRVSLYVNGEEVTDFSSTTYPSQNDTIRVANSNNTNIGRNVGFSSYLDGYLAEMHFTDGTAYDADAFGEFKEGVWVAKAPSVTYGTNGFYLDFANSADIGNDVSGEGNDWTPNNFTASDVVLDSPTDNFCTLNPIANVFWNNGSDIATLQDGNLVVAAIVSPNKRDAVGTIGASSGKWYWEIEVLTKSSTSAWSYGLVSLDTGNIYHYYAFTGNKFVNTSGSSYGATWDVNDVMGIAWDADAGTVTFYKNNVSQGTAFTGLSGTFLPLSWAFGGDNYTVSHNFGQLGFTYTPPTDHLALSTANLPDPAIDPAQGSSPEDYFNTVLFTGTDASQSVTGVGFQPDLVWRKGRSAAESNLLADAVRGSGLALVSNSTNAEVSSNAVTAFNSDGFTTIGSNGVTYVAWNWKANGSGVSNTDGTITSTVSANTESGFSIVGYTGNGTAGATVGHGLSSVPEMIIVKNRDATDAWQVYHASNTANPETDYLVLNTTAATADNLNRWNDTAPTTSVFSLGDGVEVNTNTEDYIAYCFHSVEGFSKFGSYTGNGNADGPFVYTGFRPAFVMIKRTDSTGNWSIIDSTRSINDGSMEFLLADSSAAEDTDPFYDIVSNGFKLRDTALRVNASGGTYIYMAFAEMPFRYSLGR